MIEYEHTQLLYYIIIVFNIIVIEFSDLHQKLS